ncbi:hypothetical protein [Brevundimonas sp.]|uniref:hypothetical protein n=1 Tax=Brevundimonas sp. TaxID=1871086 RepID=UPI003D0E504F
MTAAVAFLPKTPDAARRQISDESCVVAALADEAADLVAAWRGLNDAIRPRRSSGSWVGLAAALGEAEPDEREEEISAGAVVTEISERLAAIRGIALHRRATSSKGAAFQALVMNLDASDLLCTALEANPSAEDRDRLQKNSHQLERGLVSIIHQLATAGGGLPTHLVEHYMMAAKDQPSTHVERAVQHFAQG